MTAAKHWALVADGQRARVLQRAAPAGAWVEIEAAREEREDPPSHLLGADRPGRSHESMGGARHAMEPRQDPHREAKRGFAQALAGRMAAAVREGQCQGLVLVAPPAFLGDLRAALPEAATRALIGTLDKDLTRLPLREITPHLQELRPPG